MLNLSLSQLFGYGASQDNQYLVIQKSALGLTSRIDNTAESLLAAILLKAMSNFEGSIQDENNLAITNEKNLAITFSQGTDLYELLTLFSWEKFLVKRQFVALRNTLIIHTYDAQV